jgi:hypothetical protein
VPIGVTYGHDLLETRIAMEHFRSRMTLSVIEWNELFKYLGLRDDSYQTMRQDIERLRGSGGDIDATFAPGVDVDGALRTMYGSSKMRLQIVTPATIAAIQDRQREMWFSGPCVAVRIDQLPAIKQLVQQSPRAGGADYLGGLIFCAYLPITSPLASTWPFIAASN